MLREQPTVSSWPVAPKDTHASRSRQFTYPGKDEAVVIVADAPCRSGAPVDAQRRCDGRDAEEGTDDGEGDGIELVADTVAGLGRRRSLGWRGHDGRESA